MQTQSRSKTTGRAPEISDVRAPEERQSVSNIVLEENLPAVPIVPEETLSNTVRRGEGDNNSVISSSSTLARRKSAEAEYRRRLADIAKLREDAACKVAEAEEEAARAEYEAELAHSGSSHRSLRRSSSAYTTAWVKQHERLDGPCSNKVTNLPYISTTAHAVPSKIAPPAAAAAPNNTPHLQTVTLDVSQLISLATRKQGVSVPLPIFRGDFREWLLFKKSFEDTKASYTAVENVSRLQTALQGEARELVGSILVVSSNPEDVVRTLEQYYAQPEQIIMNDIRFIRGMPRLGKSAKEIITLSTKIKSSITVMTLINKKDFLFSPDLFCCIHSKLTPLLQEKWLDYAYVHHDGRPRLELMAEFLECEASKRVRYAPCDEFTGAAVPAGERTLPSAVRPVVPLRTSFILAANRPTFATSTRPAQTKKAVCNAAKCDPIPSVVVSPCSFCGELDHSVRSCSKFADLQVGERLSWVRDAKICVKCLKRSRHNWRLCRSRCGRTANCGSHHHALLHDPTLMTEQIPQTSNANVNKPKSVSVSDVSLNQSQLEKEKPNSKEVETLKNNLISMQERGRIFLKIVPVVVSGPKASRETFALLDDGANVSMIDFALADELGLSGHEDRVSIENITGSRGGVRSKIVYFAIRGRNCSEVFEIANARAISNLSLSPQSIDAGDIKGFQHLNDITDQLTYVNGSPKVLIGICDWHLLIARENRLGRRAEPAAVQTALGWALYGSLNKFSNPLVSVNHCTVSSKDEDLDLLIKEHYSLENLGIKPTEPYSAAEKRALTILDETIMRLPNGRFEVGLPWREDEPFVPNSFNHAITRLKSLEKRFIKDKSYMDLYNLNIEAYVEKDYAEPCADSKSFSESRRWYLPHFGVIHPHKPGKLRIVHNAAAQSCGVSLNSLLLPGPDLLQSLIGILLRFREGQVAIAGDIREMFPQIKIREADRDSQRYLWFSDGPGTRVTEFRMSSLIFGATSSPFTAIYVKNKNAEEFSGRYPEAAQAIIEDHYMDDFLESADSVESAARLAADVFYVHSLCGFQMREWVSNKPEALSHIPPDLVKQGFSKIDLNLGGAGASVRVLGLVWNPHNDTFSFNVDLSPPSLKSFTKRRVLRDLMRIYDPLGFLAPIVTKGKILFQRTWRLVSGWDDHLPEEECILWREWYEQIALIHSLSIPRCYLVHSSGPLHRELHIFVDASSEAYSCCVYWRFFDSEENLSTSFVINKTRVTPLRPATIPRLELQAALLGARLAATVCSEVRQKPTRRVFWSDSRIVISWTRRDPRDFKTFVGNRLGEIAELTTQDEWRWVPTALNVADDATRMSVKGIGRWLDGPSFLLLPKSEWPIEESCETEGACVPELKCNETIASCNCILVPDVCRFSSWVRLLRTTARVYQFLRVLKESRQFQTRQRPHPLLARDMKKAEEQLLKASQANSFPAEIEAAKNKRPFPASSRLRNMKVLVNNQGLLVLDSRIKTCQGVPESMRSPIVLDGRCSIVRLLIGYYHEWAGHGHNETVVNEVRQRYHIVRLRPTIRSIAASCLKCRLKKANPVLPPTGDLPDFRLEHHQRPFSLTGLDYFGPIDVTIGRRHEKRYVALFTCLVSRAIHLEVVHHLTADSAIMALRRFMARRGCPQRIYSDNGTAFVGASREIHRLWSSSTVSDYAAEKLIEWHFLPPAAPSMAGVWERLVGTVKRSLAVILKERTPKEETLLTLLAEVENIVNSRPLTHVSVASEDETALTPNHFLLGTSSSLPNTREPLTDYEFAGRSAWRKAMRLADHFCNRWVREYLPTLAPRRRPNRHEENLRIGDIVVIADCNSPRGIWPKGRIAAVFPGRDGIVRVADVATASGTLRRPVRKLVRICGDTGTPTTNPP